MTANLTSLSVGVTVLQDNAAYADIPRGASAINASSFANEWSTDQCIVGSMTVVYTKSAPLTIHSVSISGSFDDVYDFDYGSGGRARNAAIVQAGHATLTKAPDANTGKVFCTRLELKVQRT